MNGHGRSGINGGGVYPPAPLGTVLFDNQVIETDDDEDDEEGAVATGIVNQERDFVNGINDNQEYRVPGTSNSHHERGANDPIYLLTSTVARNWEHVNVSLTRVPGYGFGIAVSGGCDNPHFANGDPAIAISDVLKGGPAQGKLQINDRIISANGISLDNVDYSTAVQILRDSGPSVNLRVKRRVNPLSCKLSIPISKRQKKLTFESLGFSIAVTLQIKSVENNELGIREGDIIDKIDRYRVNELFNEKILCKELKRVVDDQLNGLLHLTVKRSPSNRNVNPQQQSSHHGEIPQQSSQSIGNLYVQPPTRGINNKSFDSTNTPLPPPPPGSLLRNTQQQQQAHPPPPPPPPPPRPPLPTEYEDEQEHTNQIQNPTRTINFIKNHVLGIRLSGGNAIGIIVSAVQKNSQADLQGLQINDKIIRVNEHDFTRNPPTREEAITILSTIPNDTLVNLTVEKLSAPPNLSCQDEFYIRTNVSSDEFKLHQVLCVTDTLVNGTVGNWEAYKLDRHGNKLPNSIIIPNVKNARELLKKSWKRTTSFRSREYEELLNSVPATEPYENVSKSVIELHSRPILLISPINDLVIECLSGIKHSSRVVKILNSPNNLEFNDGRVRVISEIPSVRCIQEMYAVHTFPFVIFLNFPNKDALKLAIKDSSKYTRAKKLHSILHKVVDKLGSYVDMVIDVESPDVAANKIHELVLQPDDARVFYAPTGSRDQKIQQQTTTPKRSQSQPRSLSSRSNNHNYNHHHQRVHSTDSLARFDSPKLNFPNFNAVVPQSIDHVDDDNQELPLPSIPRPNVPVETTQLNIKQSRSTSNFAHSPVVEKRDFTVRSHSNATTSCVSPPPMIDRTKKPSTTPTIFYPLSNINSPAKSLTPKPLPPPKPRITSTLTRNTTNRNLFKPPVIPQDHDDNGQTYLNIPMNSKAAQQQQQQQQQGVHHQQQQQSITSGLFDHRGGKLIQSNVPKNLIPIEVFIPEGAIPRGETVNVWFQVVDYNIRSNDDNPNAQKKMLSPLVKFGPENYRFQTPVNISIPQYVSTNTPAKVLMNNQSDYWTKIDIQNGNFDANESEIKLVCLSVQQF